MNAGGLEKPAGPTARGVASAMPVEHHEQRRLSEEALEESASKWDLVVGSPSFTLLALGSAWSAATGSEKSVSDL